MDTPILRILVANDGSNDVTAAIAGSMANPATESTASTASAAGTARPTNTTSSSGLAAAHACGTRCSSGWHELRLLRQAALGKAAALNAAIAAVTTPLIVLLDADGLGPQKRLRDAVQQLAEGVARTAHVLEQGMRLAFSRVLGSVVRTLLLFSDDEGTLLLGWRVWDPLAMASAERLRWEPYRRRRSQPAGLIAAGPPGGSTININPTAATQASAYRVEPTRHEYQNGRSGLPVRWTRSA